MSLIDKIMTNIRGIMNDAIDNAANPAVEARQRVRDLDEAIRKANAEMVNVEAEYMVVLGRAEKEEKTAADFNDKANLALDKNREDLAREALLRVKDARTRAATYKASAEAMKPMIDDLKNRLSKLQETKRSLETSAEMMQARLNVASAQEKAAGIMESVNGMDSSNDFGRLEDKVAQKEARAKVITNQVDQASGRTLDEELKALGDTQVDDMLADLKAQRNQKQ